MSAEYRLIQSEYDIIKNVLGRIGVRNFAKLVRVVTFDICAERVTQHGHLLKNIARDLQMSVPFVSQILSGNVTVKRGKPIIMPENKILNAEKSYSYGSLILDSITATLPAIINQTKLTKRISNMFQKIKEFLLSPPKFLESKDQRLKSQIAQDWREIITIDVIIFAFLAVSVRNLAFVFGAGQLTFLSVVEAIAVEFSMWVMSRAVAKRVFAYENRFWTKLFLWLGILVFVGISTSVNVLYGMWDHSAESGIIKFITDDSALVVYTKHVAYAFLGVIIIFMSLVKGLLFPDITRAIEDMNAPIEIAEPIRKRKRRVVVVKKGKRK